MKLFLLALASDEDEQQAVESLYSKKGVKKDEATDGSDTSGQGGTRQLTLFD